MNDANNVIDSDGSSILKTFAMNNKTLQLKRFSFVFCTFSMFLYFDNTEEFTIKSFKFLKCNIYDINIERLWGLEDVHEAFRGGGGGGVAVIE